MNAIEMRGLRKVYKGTGKTRRGRSAPAGASGWPSGAPTPPTNDVIALDALDLDIRAGEFFGLLGPNGAGKTTAIGILTTRILPTAGKAIVAGADVVADSVRVRQTIGAIQPQQIGLMFGVIVAPMIFFGCAYYPWQGLSAVPVMKYAVLINPLVYVAEGMRAALTPTAPHMPLGIVVLALLFITAVFWMLGIRSFMRRALG